MTGKYGTNFLESEILLAMIAGHREEAERLLGGMNDSERSTLRRACRDVIRCIDGSDGQEAPYD